MSKILIPIDRQIEIKATSIIEKNANNFKSKTIFNSLPMETIIGEIAKTIAICMPCIINDDRKKSI